MCKRKAKIVIYLLSCFFAIGSIAAYLTDADKKINTVTIGGAISLESWFERTGSRDAKLSLVSGSEWQMLYDGNFGLSLPCPDGGEGYHSSEFTFEMPEDGQVSFNMSLIM